MNCVLGVDGGGTKTAAVIIDTQGRILGAGRIGACNLQNMGEERTKSNLAACVQQCLDSAGLTRSSLTAAVFGVGGLDSPEDLATYQRVVAEIIPGIPTAIENDAFIGLYSGTFGRPGIVAVAGTGSIVAGEDETGARGRVGGWGYLFGDEGSAFDIGRRAVIAAAEHFDGRGPATALTKALLAAAGAESFPGFLSSVYRRTSLQTWVASLAETVSRVADSGDPVARAILRESGTVLGSAVCTLAGKLRFPSGSIDLVLIGGVFRSTLVLEAMKERLVADTHKFRVIRPGWAPVVGAVVKALQMVGEPLTTEVERRLQEGLKENHDLFPPVASSGM